MMVAKIQAGSIHSTWLFRFLRLSLLAAAASVLTACGGAQVTQNSSGGTGTPSSIPPAGSTVSVTVSPGSTTANIGGVSVSFTLTIVDANKAGVTWQVNGIAGGNSTYGTISAAGVYLTPALLPSPSVITITAVSVTDPTQFATTSVTLVDPNQPQGSQSQVTIGGAPATNASTGQTYTFTPTARSKTGGKLTFSISNKPSWATFSSATGTLSGQPASIDQGTYSNISISVSDGIGTANLASFTITVKPGVTGSVTLSWAPPSVRTDGSPLTNLAGFRIYYGNATGVYTTSISVPNPGVTTYVVANLPAGQYFFVATAYDATGAESSYSPVANKTIG